MVVPVLAPQLFVHVHVYIHCVFVVDLELLEVVVFLKELINLLRFFAVLFNDGLGHLTFAEIFLLAQISTERVFSVHIFNI